jgi:hypothetical protein
LKIQWRWIWWIFFSIDLFHFFDRSIRTSWNDEGYSNGMPEQSRRR